jgi:hypothetical protein
MADPLNASRPSEMDGHTRISGEQNLAPNALC